MSRHPELDIMLRYSAGTLEPALAFAVAAHQFICNDCDDSVNELNAIGGNLVENSSDSILAEDAFDALMRRIDNQPQKLSKTAIGESILPENYAIASEYLPLLQIIEKGAYDSFNWSKVTRKIFQSDIAVNDPEYKVEVLKFSPGAKIPKHTHRGNEFTVILQGDYVDETGHYKAGDFIHMTNSDNHQPIAGNDGCICLAVTDAPLKFTGTFGPILNFFAS